MISVLFVFSVLFGEDRETATYKPTDVILINCGTAFNTIDSRGRTWTPEQPKVFAWNSVNVSFPSKASESELLWKDVPAVPYKTVRIFRSKFTYSFTVSSGWKFLRLYFFPSRYRSDFDAVKSFFTVTVNGFTLLKNFSVNSSDSGRLIKEFIVPVLGGSKTLNLTFRPSPNSLAFINGLEIVSMPDRFYTKGGFDDNITDVGSNGDFKIDDTTVLETVYRVDVGGGMNVKDTGMFRQWLPNYGSPLGDSGNVYIMDFTINYTEKTPAYVAPREVYTTLYVRPDAKDHMNLNWTWLFPVDAGFNYLVRLHFCETMVKITKPGQRMFSIIIGNQIAKAETDVILLSGGPLIPMYLDFRTLLASNTSKTGERVNLRLDLCPNQYSYDAILNGIEIFKLNDSRGNLAGQNLVPINPIMLGGDGKLDVFLIIILAVCSAIGLVTFFIVAILLVKRKKRKDNRAGTFKVLLKQYTYAELKKITKSFSHTLGKGGFGTVYRGKLSNGVKVAVKVMQDLKGTGEDFINEVTSMSQTSHVNIVSLLGFCYEGSKRAIVYEFLKNGSLDQFISRENSSTQDVKTLNKIALGIAQGLEYLHYGCKTRIVHFDIKPQNILLDDNLCPKVSDFGLAKLCEKRESIVSLIDTRGTIGYIAPEVFSRTYGGVSHKSDVYSYGMLVLEMVGAKNKEIVETAASNTSLAYFPEWIYKELENAEQTWRFGDEITREEKETAKKMVLVGLWCIQPCPLDRPPMNKVVVMMDGSLDALEIPPNPSMHISRGFIAECSSLSDGGEIIRAVDSANT
ncbi:unnamed protein product [Eruca vesicaria subsp. sativa]|uniref:Protein kinase domain-containing protein n=1 Tax=Eruca vesicaria subsp. sativa TaxID=29727 RepID=A0ABC8M0T1_ERUVS|nr:unnamed protein product [Eruca vesicaria subsp. sativa]